MSYLKVNGGLRIPIDRPRNLSYVELGVKPTEVAGHFAPVWVYLKRPFIFIFTSHQVNEMYSQFLKEQPGACNNFFYLFSIL